MFRFCFCFFDCSVLTRLFCIACLDRAVSTRKRTSNQIQPVSKSPVRKKTKQLLHPTPTRSSTRSPAQTKTKTTIKSQSNTKSQSKIKIKTPTKRK
jgi:hypothetical protein